jgi:hypothetical protein
MHYIQWNSEKKYRGKYCYKNITQAENWGKPINKISNYLDKIKRKEISQWYWNFNQAPLIAGQKYKDIAWSWATKVHEWPRQLETKNSDIIDSSLIQNIWK